MKALKQIQAEGALFNVAMRAEFEAAKASARFQNAICQLPIFDQIKEMIDERNRLSVEILELCHAAILLGKEEEDRALKESQSCPK